MKRKLLILCAAVMTAVALAGPAGAAGNEPAPTVGEGKTIKDRSDTVVVHFGYDGHKTYSSPVLDGADPRSADPANYLPQSLVREARAARPADAKPLLCTLFVDKVKANGLVNLKATTNQDCSGGFRKQWTQAQFAENRGGWHRVTTSIKGRERTTATNDSTFGLRCTGGPVPRHAYRLEARGYAVATDGFGVGGALQYGKSATYTCL